MVLQKGDNSGRGLNEVSSVDVLKKTRFFGGKEYWLYGTAEEETVARYVAATMRGNDCYARVTKARGYWKIWIREKG